MRKKAWIWRILPWVLLAAVIGGIVYVGYLLWGKPETEPLYTAEIIRREGEDTAEPVVLDNGKLHLELDPLTTQFVLTDAYGHEWKSNPFADPAASGETIASGDRKNALASPLNVYYRLPKKAVDNMYDAYTYSVTRSAYTVEKIDDTTVEVNYSIGDIAAEYLVPEMLTTERYEALSDKVKEAGGSKAKSKFTAKFTRNKAADITKALTGSSRKDRDEAMALVENYPHAAIAGINELKASDKSALSALETQMAEIGYSDEEKNLDIILTRSSYQYAYRFFTPESLAEMQAGSAEDQQIAAAALEKNPELSEKAGYLLQRVDRAVTPGRMEALLAGSDAQKAYANELIAQYPDIQTEPYTIVTIPEEEKAKWYTVDELLDESGYSEEDQVLEGGLFAKAEKSVEHLFDVKVRYRLDGSDFVAEVPYGEMKFNSAKSSLSAISLLPMFGAVGAREDGTYEDGYLLVPEGGGALIRFNNQKLQQTAYYADAYGYDYGIKRLEFVSESKAQFPVFGILRENQSFLCVVEGGSSFVSIRADINGNTVGTDRSSYNYANARASVLHVDQYNVSAKTAELQLMYEKKIPDTTLVQRYRFAEDGDYVKLAASYGDYLREKYPQLKDKQASEEVPVSVELVGAIDKRVVVAGLPVNRVVATTTFRQGQEILDRLAADGIVNLNARYAGWLRGGVRQKVLTGVHVLGELGGENGAKALIEAAGEKHIPLYFDAITAFAYDSGLFDGFLAPRDGARHITRELAELFEYSPIYYTEDSDRPTFNLVHPDYAQKNAGRLISWLQEKGAEGISFRDIGYMLSADYDPNRVTDRERVKEMNIETLAAAKAAGEKVMVKEGFDFTLPYADIVTDMDLSGNRYVLLDRFIPFYQIAIHGLVDYTGRSLNLEGDYRTELLRSIEYGAGLNYTFTAEDASVTQETNYTGLYGTTFDSWEQEAKETILRYQREAKGLNRQRITGHEALNDHVTVTVYEDGTRVYVNYGTEEYRGEAQVPARDYVIVGKEGK